MGSQAAVPKDPTRSPTRRVVFLSLAVQIPQTAAVFAAAVVTGSSALVAQTFAAGADLAVQVLLVIGIYASVRGPDDTHPLGYGRERYFWSLYAALAIFVSGFAIAIQEALNSVLHPEPVSNFAVGYVVIAANLVLDGISFTFAWRETRRRARARDRSVAQYASSTTEPATVTELIGNSIAFFGSTLTMLALALTQATDSPWPDALASGLIGLALILAAVALTHQNRSLLTGRGAPPRVVEQMREVIAALPGIVDIPDLFAVVVGPAMFIVDGDVTLEDRLDVPQVEALLARAAAELRSHWPEIRYVYLTPVPEGRPRGQYRASGAP